MLKGFKEFLLRGNVVDLAVAVIIGGAFGAVVTALVKDLLTPLIAAIVGKPDFSAIVFTVNGSQFMLTSGQNPTPSAGRNQASIPPSAPPIISSGASTPPEVPEPRDTDQMIDFTTSMPTITFPATSPWRRSPITS